MTINRSEFIAPPLSEEPGLGALTLPGYLREAVARFGDREAICWTDLAGQRRSCSYRELESEARRVAKAVLAMGLGKNARIGILASNRPEWLMAAFGIAMAGGVVVALNTFSTRHELHYQLAQADVQLLLMESAIASQNFAEDIRALCPELASSAPGQLLSRELPYLRRVVCLDGSKVPYGIEAWEHFLAAGDSFPDALLDTVVPNISPVDQALIFYSSGSTALPKAIQHTHRAAALQGWRFGRVFEVSEHSRAFPTNGFFFSGNFAQAVGFLSRGGCLVLLQIFDPEAALQLLQSERVTSIIAWPHQEARMQACAGWDAADLSALKYVSYNSALRKHPTVATDWNGYQAHGMTETFTIISVTHGDNYRAGSFGAILPGNTVRIIDPDSGEILPLGETGEILVKGPTTMLGYLKVAPEESFDAEGFIHTGDAGHLAEDGHLYWQGRLNDIIKTGGANVSPTEVDEIIARHRGVQSCYTVGIPDETLGERVVTCVVRRGSDTPTEEDIRSFARQWLATYKTPRAILFLREEELPMTGSAKVRRADLKRLASDRLGTAGRSSPR